MKKHLYLEEKKTGNFRHCCLHPVSTVFLKEELLKFNIFSSVCYPNKYLVFFSLARSAWYTSFIPAVGRLRLENFEFETKPRLYTESL